MVCKPKLDQRAIGDGDFPLQMTENSKILKIPSLILCQMHRLKKFAFPAHTLSKSSHSLASPKPKSPIFPHPQFWVPLLNNNHSLPRPLIQQIHSLLITTGSLYQSSRIPVVTALMRHYAFGEFPFEAVALFRDVTRRTTTMMCRCFDSFGLLYLIKGCDDDDRVSGFQVHGVVVRLGFGANVYVMTALLDMYVDCGSAWDARKVFDEMSERSVVSWNAMVTGLMRLDEVEAAWDLFERMPVTNVVSWTGMIDGFTRANRFGDAFRLFRRMVMNAGVLPNEITCLAVFPAVSNLGDLENCQAIHTYGVKKGYNVGDIRFRNCLIDAYAKCGCVPSASRVFEEESVYCRNNLVSWTSLISGFAMHGMANEAAENFERMVDEGLQPNQVTFLSLLSACSHGGLVDEGVEFFQKMINQFQILPDTKHYGCVIDMLARASRLNEAEKMALEVPEEVQNGVIWRTLLGACNFHGNVEMAERVTKRIQDIERGYGGDYVLMSNILTSFRKFDDAVKVRTLMDERYVSKVPGHSLI